MGLLHGNNLVNDETDECDGDGDDTWAGAILPLIISNLFRCVTEVSTIKLSI